MRKYLDVLDDMGTKKRLALFSSKTNSGVHTVVRTKQSADPIALDKTNELLGHVTTTDQGALWQELMGHPKKINYDPVMISHSPPASRARRFGLIWTTPDPIVSGW
jgi:hypothetical protein